MKRMMPNRIDAVRFDCCQNGCFPSRDAVKILLLKNWEKSIGEEIMGEKVCDCCEWQRKRPVKSSKGKRTRSLAQREKGASGGEWEGVAVPSPHEYMCTLCVFVNY
uniref:Uncharacterized protein n=1 Tax=Opuntia streptacantha TaxID=393608 RepID=A0A7C9EK24_OPUST